MMLFGGNATPDLAQIVAKSLYLEFRVAVVGGLSDCEISLQINENVRGSAVFIL
ncbi:ribose-phosphate pyrophosphokinase, partial [Pseudoalteromonas sp. S1610]